MNQRRKSNQRARILCSVVLWLGAGIQALTPAYSQIVNAGLSGQVLDSGHKAVAGARVSVTNVATGERESIVSTAEGNYQFSILEPGNYVATVEEAGFKTSVVSGIHLLVSQKANIDFTLEVGSVESRVEVADSTPLLDTSSSSLGTVIEKREIVDLPLNLRRFGALATLVPGTVSDNGGFASSGAGSTFSEQTFNANGSRSASNGILIDGVEARNLKTGGFSVQPPPDAVEEFKIQTNIYDASFGNLAGSVINVVTKSGSNNFHGTLYEFLRNDAFDAKNYFAGPGQAKAELRRNQFGGAVGGPIWRDKYFFFFNYEGLRLIQGNSSLSRVPTPAELSGDLSSAFSGTQANLCGSDQPALGLDYDSGQLFDPSTLSNFTCPNGNAILVGQPIAGNQIQNIHPAVQALLATNPYPKPNIAGVPYGGNNFYSALPSTRADDQYDFRVDHPFSQSDHIFARYLLGKTHQNSPGALPSFSSLNRFTGHNAAIGETHAFSSTLFNEARFGFQRNQAYFSCGNNCPRPAGFLEGLGIDGLATIAGPSFEAFPAIGIANIAGAGDTATPDLEPDMVEKYADNVTWVRGQHTLKAGADMQFFQVLGESGVCNAAGNFSFSGQYSSVATELSNNQSAGLADFLLGYPTNATYTQKFQKLNRVGGSSWSYYVHDDVKATKSLTINVGIRYEYHRPSYDKYNNRTIFYPYGPKFAGYGNATVITSFANAQNDGICSDPQYSWAVTADGRCGIADSGLRSKLGFTGRTLKTLQFPDHQDWAPRLGVAWRPLGNDRLFVRAGTGVFYDTGNFNSQENPSIFSQSTVNYVTGFGAAPEIYNGEPVTLTNVLPAGSQGSVPALYTQGFSGTKPNVKTPRQYQWSFGVASQVDSSLAIEATYVGNHGLHGDSLRFFNQPEPGIGDLQPRRPYPDYGGGCCYFTSDANSSYDALQVKVDKRYSQGFSVLGSYTYGKTITDNEGDEGFSGGGFSNFGLQDDNNPRGDRGRAYSDARQRLSISGIFQLPLGEGRRFVNRGGLVNELVGGWELSLIGTMQSGFPFTVFSPADYSNTGSPSYRPDRVCNGKGPRTLQNWFNVNCFSTDQEQADLQNGTPRFGNSGRNILDAPGLQNWDMAFLKNFKLTEKLNLQYRGELYSAFNHPQFGPPTSYLESGTTAQITSANGSRSVQFALKLIY